MNVTKPIYIYIYILRFRNALLLFFFNALLTETHSFFFSRSVNQNIEQVNICTIFNALPRVTIKFSKKKYTITFFYKIDRNAW